MFLSCSHPALLVRPFLSWSTEYFTWLSNIEYPVPVNEKFALNADLKVASKASTTADFPVAGIGVPAPLFALFNELANVRIGNE